MCDSIVLSRDGETVSLSVDPDGTSVTYDCGETSTFRRGIQCVTEEFLSTGWVTIRANRRAKRHRFLPSFPGWQSACLKTVP